MDHLLRFLMLINFFQLITSLKRVLKLCDFREVVIAELVKAFPVLTFLSLVEFKSGVDGLTCWGYPSYETFRTFHSGKNVFLGCSSKINLPSFTINSEKR